MGCYSPLKGYRCQDGSFSLNGRFAVSPMVVPCGGCIGCRLRRSGEWAIRGTHEMSLFENNCFVTLTYDDKRLPYRCENFPPANVSLYYPDFQLFMKAVRDRFGEGIRFMVSGEYGDKFGRPHWHVIFFNLDFSDKYVWYKSKTGHLVYRSDVLEELWPWGNSDIGSVTYQSIGYVARYVMKKVSGKAAPAHYEWVDPSTGQVFDRVPELARYSLKPGIGYEWFQKYYSDVYPHDYVVFNGRKYRPPRYYDKLYERLTGKPVRRTVTLSDGTIIGHEDLIVSSDYEELKALRTEMAEVYLDDNSPDRLKVKEEVAMAQLSRLKRTLV